MSEIRVRLEKLERENRLMKRAVCMSLVLLAAAVFMGQTSPPKVADEIRTRKLVLEDDAGRPRAALVADKNDTSLILLDNAGKIRASLYVDKDGPHLNLTGEAGNFAQLGAFKDGPRLYLMDQQAYRAILGTTTLETPRTGTETKRSTASLVLLGRDNHVLWAAP